MQKWLLTKRENNRKNSYDFDSIDTQNDWCFKTNCKSYAVQTTASLIPTYLTI